MPLISTLVDNFNDNIIGPEWGNAYGGVSETGGRARVPCVAGQYAGYQTAPVYTLAGSSVYLQVPLAAAVSGGTVEVQTVFAITPDPTKGTNLAININTVGNTIRFESNTNYADASAVSLTYSAATHAWLRIRETGGNVLFDTSTDGSTWTNRRTLTTPAWVTSAVNSLALDLWSYRNNGTSNFAEFDNVNTLLSGAVHQMSANLTALGNTTAAATRTAILAADLQADTGIGATANASVGLSANFVAQSDMTATALRDEISHTLNIGHPHASWEAGAPWT